MIATFWSWGVSSLPPPGGTFRPFVNDCLSNLCRQISLRAEDRGRRSQEKPNRGCSRLFLGSPCGGRGPARERDRDSTGQSESRRRRERGGEGRGGRGAGGCGGCGGSDVLNGENNERTRWQPSLMGRVSWARPTGGLEESVWELYPVPNQSSRAPSTRTVGRSSCKISKTWKVRQ